MFVSVIHRVNDPDGFADMMRNAEIPDGLHVAQVLSNNDRSTMMCLWEAPSVQSVRDYLEPATSGVCVNEYTEVDPAISMGLPAATLA
jgi:hypothetical protein